MLAFALLTRADPKATAQLGESAAGGSQSSKQQTLQSRQAINAAQERAMNEVTDIRVDADLRLQEARQREEESREVRPAAALRCCACPARSEATRWRRCDARASSASWARASRRTA